MITKKQKCNVTCCSYILFFKNLISELPLIPSLPKPNVVRVSKGKIFHTKSKCKRKKSCTS